VAGSFFVGRGPEGRQYHGYYVSTVNGSSFLTVAPPARSSFDSTRRSGDQGSISNQTIPARPGNSVEVSLYNADGAPSAEPPIKITPASPVSPSFESQNQQGGVDGGNKLSLGRPRGQSSASRRVSKILKTQVHRGQERISSISKIVALGPRQGLSHLRKTTSAPGRHSQMKN